MYVILFLLSSFVYATDVNVTYGLSGFSLKTSESKIHLTGKDLNLSLEKSDCNKKMFEEFTGEISFALKKLNIHKTKNDEAVKIEGEGKLTYESRKSAGARYFLELPEKFQRLKIKDNLRCQK